MATTNTVSSSNASTFVRMLALKNQFKIAFQRIMDYGIFEYAPFLDAISDKMIKRIDFWAYKKKQRRRTRKMVPIVNVY